MPVFLSGFLRGVHEFELRCVDAPSPFFFSAPELRAPALQLLGWSCPRELWSVAHATMLCQSLYVCLIHVSISHPTKNPL